MRIRRAGPKAGVLILAAGALALGRPSPAGAGAGPAGHPLAAGELDALVVKAWKAAGIKPAPAAGDAEWLRRVWLDLAGTVPSAAEVRAFLADARPDRRARLVDALLGSDDFAEHQADVLMQLLLGSDARLAVRLEKKLDPRPWFVDALRAHMPWDRLATEVLTASGDARENGALAFLVAHGAKGGSAEAVAGAAARAFLGITVGCAQCHDHPYDKRYRQEDFHALAAFFARTRARPAPAKADGSPAATADAGNRMTDAGNRMAEETAARVRRRKDGAGGKTLAVLDVPFGEQRMHRPGATDDVVVGPSFLGHPFVSQPRESRRVVLAREIIASDLFAKAAVNRTWAQLFGRGLVEPWSDLGGQDDPAHPPVLRALAADFVAARYDLAHLFRTLVLSAAYGRTSGGPAPGAEAAERVFARAMVRPLSADQLFDVVRKATGVEAMARARFGADVVEERLRRAQREYLLVFGDDEDDELDTQGGSVPQTLLLWNGELTNRAVRAGPLGVLGGILLATAAPAARLDEVYLTALGRFPTEAERNARLPALRGPGARPAWEDLLYALLTSTEAVTSH